ncbi:MAG: DUF4405 domain-containing protein [Betaproteobacteria bacterium]|nr:DUF4405 domain-containing protein [Betaproteobacteria bacterium]
MRLSTSHQVWIYGSFGVLFVTGGLWLIFHYFIQIEGEFGPQAHPLEPWWLRLHGAAVMLFMFVLGTLLLTHTDKAWKMRRNLTTGIAFVIVNAVLIVSGYMLYYFGGETARPIISLVHWVIGLAAPVLVALHVWRGRVSRQEGARRRLHWRKPAVPPRKLP